MKDEPSWKTWLLRERDQAVETPEGKTNGPDRYYSREDPAANARIFANLVEFDTHIYNPETGQWEKEGPVNWRHLWETALPFLSNLETRQDPNWKWRANFTFMLKVMDTAQKAKLFTEQIVAYDLGYPLKGERLNMEEGRAFFLGIINRGPAYFEIWEDYKLLFGDQNLSEIRFLGADIAFCEDQIEECKRKIELAQHPQTRGEQTDFIALFRERIRAYRARLEELREEIQRITKKRQPDTDEIFINRSEALALAQQMGLINEVGKWSYKPIEKPLAAFVWLLREKGLFHDGVSPSLALRTIAKSFGLTGQHKNTWNKFQATELKKEAKRILGELEE